MLRVSARKALTWMDRMNRIKENKEVGTMNDEQKAVCLSSTKCDCPAVHLSSFLSHPYFLHPVFLSCSSCPSMLIS
jgi:hypothetical protein